MVSVPGASTVFRGGAITYATDTKASVLGVATEQLAQTGPVDPEVAIQMAEGTRKLFDAAVGLSTTGVAGPGPSDGWPAGTIWLGISGLAGSSINYFDSSLLNKLDSNGKILVKKTSGEGYFSLALNLKIAGDRDVIRAQSVASILALAKLFID